MVESNYIFGKHTFKKQVVHYSYKYKNQTVFYHFKFPYEEGEPNTYYTKLVDEEIAKLRASGELDKYSEEYLKKMAWRKKYGKPVKIAAIVGGVVVVGLTIGLTVGLLNRGVLDNVVFESETLEIDRSNVTLHRDANFTFTVSDFYVNYGYYLPDTIDQVIVNKVELTANQYSYSNGHLKISGQYVTGEVYIKAEANYVHFENDSWSNIIKYANGGLKEVYLRYGLKSVVGATHDLELGNEKVKVRVIGEGHDYIENSNGQAATLTLEFETAVSSSTYADINFTCNEIYNALSSDIKNEVKSVRKSNFNGSDLSFTTWTVFPLSYREINGYESVDEEYRTEESCYEYYHDLDTSSMKAKRKKSGNYWLRDVDNQSTSNAISINEEGNTARKPQGNTLGLAPAFAIGETASFTTDTWENVAYYSNYGLDALKEYYGRNSFIGLERELILNDHTVHHVRVIGENHDALSGSNNKVAALTFEFVDSITNDALPYNNDLVNSTNYSESSIRTYVGEQIGNFPKVLVDNIPYVSKKTVEYKSIEDVYTYPIPSCEVTDERLFLLSVREVGDVFYGAAEPYSLEEEAYQFYRTRDFTEEGLSRANKKRIKNGTNYWLRSHYCMDTKAHIVDYQGRTFGLFGQEIDTIVRDVDKTFYCYPAFSLGYSDEPITFANDSWENVCYHAGLGLDHLKDYYQVDSFIGYEKEITLDEETGPQVYKVRVIGENEDFTFDDKLAALTFEFTTGVTPTQGSRYYDDVDVLPHYADSVIRNYCNNKVLSKLPEIVQDSIKTVKKKTAAVVLNEDGEREYVIDETEEKLFVLSRNEISDTYDVESEEIKEVYLKENPTYTYYQQAKAMVRYKVNNDINGHYWLRTPFLDYGSVIMVHCINAYGYFNQLKPTHQLAVAPAFSI